MLFFKLKMKKNGYVSHEVLLKSREFLNLALKISILFTSDCIQVVKVLEVGRNCHGVNHWFHDLIKFDVFHIEILS
jgi:hypothetical protein